LRRNKKAAVPGDFRSRAGGLSSAYRSSCGVFERITGSWCRGGDERAAAEPARTAEAERAEELAAKLAAYEARFGELDGE